MITFLTDFGIADYFVPAVKGVILSLNPQATIIDLTHEIPAQDIQAGAFTLGACYHNFPAGTIHLAVVDPSIGSERRPIIVAAGNYFFVGPDNGIFSYIYQREKSVRVFHANKTALFRHNSSSTFHGRDVFAPLAAWLSKGLSPENFGAEINDYTRLNLPRPQVSNQGISGEIIHLDHFGNCITNLTENELKLSQVNSATQMIIGEQRVDSFGTHFAQHSGTENLFAYVGSAGYWEVALWQDSAAKKFGFTRGTQVKLILQ